MTKRTVPYDRKDEGKMSAMLYVTILIIMGLTFWPKEKVVYGK